MRISKYFLMCSIYIISEMSSDTISLMQGRHYANRESKFKGSFNGSKIVESFTTDNNSNNAAASNFVIVEQKVKDIQLNQQRYDKWLNEYKYLQSIVEATTANVTAPKSSYNGQNIQQPDGAMFYVTDDGVMKYWPSPDIFNATAGQNGVPSSVRQISSNIIDISGNFGNFQNQQLPGNLSYGSSMVSGQSVGSEGRNIWVNRASVIPAGQYKGCFTVEDPNPLTPIINSDDTPFNYDTCLIAASNNNYSQFAVDSGMCYGTNTAFTPIPLGLKQLWHSGTASTIPGNTARILNNGTLIVESALGAANAGPPIYSTYPQNQSMNWGNNQTAQTNPDYQDESYLTLQSDNNMVITNGSPTNMYGVSFQSYTNGQALGANPLWVATAGKTGSDSFGSNDGSLQPGEWIGSANGDLQLIMQVNGDLVLYTSDPSTYITNMQMCSQDTSGNMVGNSYSYALYQMENIADNSQIGNVGYVSSNSILKQYPTTMISRSNNYVPYPHTDSSGNNISSATSTNAETCMSECNLTQDCVGVVFDTAQNMCYVKNGNMYPVGGKQSSSTSDMYVRDFAVNNNNTCSKQITPVDSATWSNYIQSKQMTEQTECGLAKQITQEQNQMNVAAGEMKKLSKIINTDINFIIGQNQSLLDTMGISKTSYADMAIQYQETTDSVNKLSGKQHGMNAIIEDTDLVVKHDNFMYSFWFFLAIVLVLVTIGVMRKKI